ncbi:GMC oxidoreductase [Riemerella anatipestifer]|uniref:GMC oxidoreductase n=1 Tax=Riemerella anatipestifer TaxID=34085 RepID=A0AAP3AQK6_RIEAN|nr:GMC oxidoreductase [Riemerella anatipestifer]MBT0574244.1 GMC family oxidoreductase [Riemerella anatipestifer]MCO7319430.1 GMC oxidoreductase [Riemerella anatipestifer]MCQ4155752.1 GMC oxidoreductase [Riemerella anatipestifer]MCQ4181689.1 GMC oxidoreductase [Riemerella anatipestifer]MCU7569374.1 GMC oxidoreductase [Riemerella anatipestifer]
MNRKEFLTKLGLTSFGLLIGRSMIGKQLLLPTYINGGHFTNILVGTGYGNAVVAERLANAGHQVLMIEMGLDWEGYKLKNPHFKFYKMTSPGKESTWMNKSTQAPIGLGNMNSFDKFTGILERKDFTNIKIYLGRGVGGGSLVNGGMTVTPKKEYLKEVYDKVGVSLPVDELYDTYFPLANHSLGKNLVPDDVYNSEWYTFSRMGIEEGANSGFTPVIVPNLYDFDYMRDEIAGKVPRSATNVEVIYGNNYGKRDLTKTYLKRALDTGNVTIIPQHKVDYIEALPSGEYALVVKQIDTLNREVGVKKFTCDKLYLGAGSLGTTELLLKSKALNKLPNINDEVGKYWGNNGNTMASRYTAFVLGHHSRGNYQSTMPVRGLDNFNDVNYPFFAEIAPMPVFGTYTALYLVVSKVDKFGSITYDLDKQKIALDWDTTHNNHMRKNAEYFLSKMNQNGSTGWFNNKYVNNTILLPKNGVDETICYHPLGGCVLGKVTDLHGRVHGYNNLYVTGGSLIPGSLGVNPYVTITALSEYCIDTILKNDY